MIRNLKALGLVLMVVFVLSGVVTSAAQAEIEKPGAVFTASVGATETAKIDGEQILAKPTVFKIGVLPAWTCAETKFIGKFLTAGSSSKEYTVQPVYETCHAIYPLIGTKDVTITMHNCGYLFTATTTETKGVKEFTEHTSVECPPGQQIEIHIYKNVAHTETLCTYDLEPQTSLTGITLTNKINEPASANDIAADVNISGVRVVKTTGIEALCGPENNIGTYSGELTLRTTRESGTFLDFSISS